MAATKKTAKKSAGKKMTPGAKFTKKNNKATKKTAASARKTLAKTKSPTREMAY